jgi:P-type E1-E2 ATPase
VTLGTVIAFAWHTARDGLDGGILCALAVVVIASPGLIASGAHLAVWTALARAADEHILLRGGNALERLARIKVICFAKTGALTAADPRLIDYVVADVDRESEILSIATALARTSPHVYSVAIADFAHRIAAPATTEAKSVAGRGVIARVEGGADWAYLGSHRFVKEAGLAMSATIRDVYLKSVEEGLPTVFAGWDGRIQVLFVFAESLRPGVHSLLQALQSADKKCAVITGDHWQWAAALTSDPGVSVLTDVAPEEKPSYIRTLHEQVGAVAMVGDGINDAPALAAADLGIALGCSADISSHSADVCLLGNDLERLPWLFGLADGTVRMIRHNLFWACGYNIVGIGLAMTGTITPIPACLLMVFTSALVIANSLRLRRFELEVAETTPPKPASGHVSAWLETPLRRDTEISHARALETDAKTISSGVNTGDRVLHSVESIY